MRIVLIGNGILSLMTGLRLVQRNNQSEIVIIGPSNREGCATLAAPAMLNSYAELIKRSLANDIDRKKFKISRLARYKWGTLFDDLEEFDVSKPSVKFGTYILNNTTTDHFDDININAIKDYLDEYEEKYEFVDPSKIPGYEPSAQQRALRALYIPGEGFVNSEQVLFYLEDYLKNKGVTFIDDKVQKILEVKNKITSVELDTLKEQIIGDQFILAPGANFSQIIEASNLSIGFQKILYGSGISVELKPNKKTLENCVRTPNRGFACGVYSAPRTEETIIVGASNHVATFPLYQGMTESISNLLTSSMEQINSSLFSSGFVGTKIGWRPTSVDTYPLIGKTSISNLIVATGTKRDGFHMSPVISEYLTTLCFEEEYEYNDLFLPFYPEREVIRNISREKAIDDIVNHEINAYYQHGFVPDRGSMLDQHREMLRREAIEVHDRLGLKKWGIPPELYPIFRGGHENLLGEDLFQD